MKEILYHLNLGNCDLDLIQIKTKDSMGNLYVVRVTEIVSCLSEDKETKITEYLNGDFRSAVGRFGIETRRYTENYINDLLGPLPF